MYQTCQPKGGGGGGGMKIWAVLLRRLAAKCAGLHALPIILDILAPWQLGHGMSGGVEAAVYAAPLFLQNLKEDQVIMKVDFTNAFNSIPRDKMLCAVEKHIPELLPLVHSVYCSSSFLPWGNEVLLSSGAPPIRTYYT